MMELHLTWLPPEIPNAIFGEFCVHCRHEPHDAYFRGDRQQPNVPSWYSLNRHALYSLCLTSRHILPYAQSVLYHEFMPGYGDSWRTTCYTWPHRLTNFLCTISRRPDLAAMVKRIHFDPKIMYFVGPEQGLQAGRVAAANLEMDASEMEDYHRSPQSRSCRTWQGNHYVDSEFSRELVYMIVLQLPNLEEISCKMSYLNSQPPYQRRLIRSSASSHAIPPRPPIRRISIANDNGKSVYMDYFERTLVSDILEWAEPDHLQELYLHMFAAAGNPLIPPQSLANLKTLQITRSRFTKSALFGILHSVRALENFIYESAPPTNGSFLDYCSLAINDPFEPSDAVECLQKHEASLARLHLQMTDYHCRDSTKALLPSLRDFKLKHLLVSNNVVHDRLFGTPQGASPWVSLLPTSLESLAITGNILTFLHQRRIVPGLLGFAEAAAAKEYPHLKLVTCDRVYPMDTYQEHVIPSAFKAGGVDFELSSWPLSEPTPNGNDFWPGGISPESKPAELPPEDEDDYL